MQSENLIQSLIEQTRKVINTVEKLKNNDLQTLTWKHDQNSWSILECLEHLNLYGNFYLPEIESKIKNSTTKSETEFKSGFLGNYFAKSMLPKEKLNKMKTFKDKNPLNANLDKSVIDKFIEQQVKIVRFTFSIKKCEFEQSENSDIHFKFNKTKIGRHFSVFHQSYHQTLETN